MKTQNMNNIVQFRKKMPKMKYDEKVAYQLERERMKYAQAMRHKLNPVPGKKVEKVLDGILLMHSCRVRNPMQAIRSKLTSENIVDVREEDLIYFRNLTHLDLSDNHVNLN